MASQKAQRPAPRRVVVEASCWRRRLQVASRVARGHSARRCAAALHHPCAAAPLRCAAARRRAAARARTARYGCTAALRRARGRERAVPRRMGALPAADTPDEISWSRRCARRAAPRRVGHMRQAACSPTPPLGALLRLDRPAPARFARATPVCVHARAAPRCCVLRAASGRARVGGNDEGASGQPAAYPRACAGARAR